MQIVFISKIIYPLVMKPYIIRLILLLTKMMLPRTSMSSPETEINQSCLILFQYIHSCVQVILECE